ncbi:hypothetical protein LP419_22545 [Massilia sp. H-1]|nr:hypothetical protein LP419_22545 [Massilia sp. H-1]
MRGGTVATAGLDEQAQLAQFAFKLSNPVLQSARREHGREERVPKYKSDDQQNQQFHATP